MSTQNGSTTSSTVTSDVLERPYGEIKSNTKLLTRPSRHAANQSTSTCDQTLWPVEQTIKRTMSPHVQTARPTRQSQQPLQAFEHTQKQPRPRQSSAEGSRPTQQLQPPSRPQPRRQPSKLPRSPQENLTTTRQPSRHSRPQGLSQTEMANQHGNNFEHWLGPPLPTFKRRPDGVQERRHSRRQSQPISDQRVRQLQQIPNQTVDRALHPSNPVRSNQAAQQIPRSSQPISAGFPPLQQRQSDKAAGSDSNSSSESHIELSPARRREIIISVNEFVQCVMASMLSDKASNVEWKPKFRKKDISYYVDETSLKPGQTRFCCVSRTHATVDELMKLFVVSDANSMARNKRILSDSLLETQVLSVLRRPTKERPMNSMYVQYTSYRSPGLMADREVCIVVATDMIHQPDGSTIGYCLWETVDGPEFAKATNKLEPSIMFRSGFFFRRSGRRRQSTTGYPNQSFTKIVYMVGLEPGGWVPGLTTRLLMEKFGTTVTRLCSHFRRKQLDSRTFVMKTE